MGNNETPLRKFRRKFFGIYKHCGKVSWICNCYTISSKDNSMFNMLEFLDMGGDRGRVELDHIEDPILNDREIWMVIDEGVIISFMEDMTGFDERYSL